MLAGDTPEKIKQDLLTALEEQIGVKKKKEQQRIDARTEKSVKNISKEKGYKKAATPQERQLYYDERMVQIEEVKDASIEFAYKKFIIKLSM